MELTYPAPLIDSLHRLIEVLAEVSVEDETAVCSVEPGLWAEEDRGGAEPAASPLAQFAEFRAMGAYALPLAKLLTRVGRSYVPLPDAPTRGPVALGWPDATAPWFPNEPLAATVDAGGAVSGSVSVAPFCVPAGSLVFLAQADNEPVLVACGPGRLLSPLGGAGGGERGDGHVERVGDGFRVSFEKTQGLTLAQGDAALQAWERAVLWERLALLGLAVGVIDRAWRIALDALCEGQRQGSFVAGEQVAQFQLADNYIERLAGERLAQDVALDADRGRPIHAKLAVVRYYTSGQAERCAARALHLASLFLPRLVPIARWLTQRAHHLSVFGAAREHEIRLAAAGLAAGMRLD